MRGNVDQIVFQKSHSEIGELGKKQGVGISSKGNTKSKILFKLRQARDLYGMVKRYAQRALPRSA